MAGEEEFRVIREGVGSTSRERDKSTVAKIGAWVLSAIASAVPSMAINGADECGSPVWTKTAERRLENISRTEGPFRVSIYRRYKDDAEERLLRIVEGSYRLYPGSILLPGFGPPPGEESPRWSVSTAGGIRVPVVVTRESVDYLVGLVQSFQGGDFSEAGGIEQLEASVEYTAEIESADTALETPPPGDREVRLFVVQMRLEWSSNCGLHCGLRFLRSRAAIVSEEGEVLELLEDPLAPTVVE